MKVAGEATLHASLDEVWKALNDPAVLVRTIPGCERLEETGPDAYRMTITAGVASIKGTYDGDVRLTDQQPPSSFVLRATGSGAPGTVNADVTVTLDDAGAGETRLRYAADAVVGGMIGGVGQRVLSGVAKKTAGEFFRNVDASLQEEPGAAGDDVLPAVAASDGQAPAAAQAGRSFTRPGALHDVVGSRPDDFVRGALVGAVIALLGVAVGAVAARRRA